jgi:hypothetical protein
MLLPSWIKKVTTNPVASLCRKYPHMCKFLGTIPSNQLKYAKVPFWNNIRIPLSKHNWNLPKNSLRKRGKCKTYITIPTKQP